MSEHARLTLYYHPLSSFCQKVLVALYENETPFVPHLLASLDDAQSAAAFKKIWRIGKFPVLRDEARRQTVAESSIIIEYLDQHYPGRVPLIPEDRGLARQVRMQDRFFDLYIQVPMQKIVGDRLRPSNKKDPHGVEQAYALLETALGMIDEEMVAKTWVVEDRFTMADCAAAPALYYANRVAPFAGHPNAAAYLSRLLTRPSFARAVEEAAPYRHLFPR